MKTIAAVASFALIGICSAASAAEFWSGVPATRQLTWSSFDSGSTSVNVTSSAGSYGGSGGQFKGYFHTGTADADEFFRFFCIDLTQYANTGPHEYSASVLVSTPLARLFDIAYPNKELGDFYDNGPTKFGQFSSDGSFSAAVYSSAFQLAVWEIYFEDPKNGLSLADGNFRSETVSGDAQKAVAKATEWLAEISNDKGSAAGWTLYKFSNRSYQDYLSATYTSVPEETDNSVPEPGTLAMLGLGIAALGAIRRRRR